MASDRSAVKGSRGASAQLTILFAVILIELIGFGLILPMLPTLAARVGASSWKIGFLFSSASLAQFLFAPFWGRLSDRYGRKTILAVSSVGSLLSYVILAFSQSYASLLLSRILAGVTAGNIAAAQAYAADITDDRNRSTGMGIIGAAFGLGFVLGPAMCVLSVSGPARNLMQSVLQALLGDPPAFLSAHPFFMPGIWAAFFSSAALALILLVLPEHRVRKPSKPRGFGSLRNSIGSVGIWLVWAWLLSFAQASLYGIFPLYLHQTFGWNERGVAEWYVAMGLGAAAIQGGLLRVIAKRVDEKRILGVGVFCFAAGLAAIAAFPRLGVFGAGLLLMTVGQSLSVPMLSSAYSKKHKPEGMGEAMGWLQSSTSLGRVAGPLWGGALYLLAPSAPFLITAAAVAAAGIATLWFTQSWPTSKRSV